jgi:hypothetical protein
MRTSWCRPPASRCSRSRSAHGTEAKADAKNPDGGPLLLISGELDHTVPWGDRQRLLPAPAGQQGVTEIVRIKGRGRALATLGWVHWHNTRRLHGFLGDRTPTEYEQAFYAAHRDDQITVGNPIAGVSIRPSRRFSSGGGGDGGLHWATRGGLSFDGRGPPPGVTLLPLVAWWAR